MHKLTNDLEYYDIYQFKGWSLKEVQQKQFEDLYDRSNRTWEKVTIGIKTTIVWGIHVPCGLRGLIMVSTSKVYCSHCREEMPADVFENLTDAMTLMKDSLEKD